VNDLMLAEQVRTLVDAVEPVTAREITDHRPPSRAGLPRRGVLVAVAAVVLVAIVSVGIVTLTRDGRDGRRVTVPPADGPTTTAQSLPASCFAIEGCQVERQRAETELGFHLRTPRGFPDGWVQEAAFLHLPGAPHPTVVPGAPTLFASSQYDEFWGPPGTSPMAGDCPYVVVQQRRALPGEASSSAGARLGADDVDLGSGLVARANHGLTICGTNPVERSDVQWVADDGVVIYVKGVGVDLAVVTAVARSMTP
jgi:hypothetical protein